MTDPFSRFFEEAGQKLEQLVRDTKPVEPRARVIPGDENVMGRICDAYKLIESAPPMRTEPIKLTEQQINAIRAQQPEKSPLELGVVAPLFGVPIVKVDTVEESTPYLEGPRYATGGIIRPGDLGTLRDEGGCSYAIPNRHITNGVPSGILNFRRKLTDEELERFEQHWRETYGGAASAHRVTYLSTPRPLPWWKRAYYRARRWLARAVLREDLILCLKVLAVIGVWLGLVFLFASGFAMDW